jgi:SEC-C motif domain protein
VKLKALSSTAECPCGTGSDYGQCCERWHKGLALGQGAPTPEALMRSRYSAYALRLHDYLMATWHGSTAPGELDMGPVKWLGLEVRATEQSAEAGVVEFIARFRDSSGRAQRLHEISRFVWEAAASGALQWWYVDGVMVED